MVIDPTLDCVLVGPPKELNTDYRVEGPQFSPLSDVAKKEKIIMEMEEEKQ